MQNESTKRYWFKYNGLKPIPITWEGWCFYLAPAAMLFAFGYVLVPPFRRDDADFSPIIYFFTAFIIVLVVRARAMNKMTSGNWPRYPLGSTKNRKQFSADHEK
jgi:hypothetical protein